MWPIPRPAARLFSPLPAILTVALMGAPAQAHTVVRFLTNLGELDVDLCSSQQRSAHRARCEPNALQSRWRATLAR